MFTLIKLPYEINALEPVISARTLEFHHGKHLQGYVDNLNKLIVGTEFENMSLEGIIAASSPLIAASSRNLTPIFNNAGQILNHNLYFTQFCQPSSRSLSGVEGPLAKQIEKQWTTLDAFKKEFEAKGATLFGSGWVWLQADAKGELSIAQYAGADNPVAHGLKPILTFDVWEHAYYLDCQNRRPAHLAALWDIVDWKVIEDRFIR
ncbi:MAG: superoxide dismutase [Bacteroidales bacterium]|nr:superoxide dismutase [Bacteroidales bacterium]